MPSCEQALRAASQANPDRNARQPRFWPEPPQTRLRPEQPAARTPQQPERASFHDLYATAATRVTAPVAAAADMPCGTGLLSAGQALSFVEPSIGATHNLFPRRHAVRKQRLQECIPIDASTFPARGIRVRTRVLLAPRLHAAAATSSAAIRRPTTLAATCRGTDHSMSATAVSPERCGTAERLAALRTGERVAAVRTALSLFGCCSA